MGKKNDRVCVSRYYPVDRIKANRMYIVQYNYSMFIANGNIYVNIRKGDDKKYYCCTIHNFKKWGGMENLKRFVSRKGKKEMKTVIDLIDAVVECGYSRELNYSEYMEIESDSLLENSDYKYGVNDLVFHGCENFHNGFEKLESPKYGLQIGKFDDTEIHFCLDLGIDGIRKELPGCILKEIEREVNGLLEANFIKPEDTKKVRFTCFAKVGMQHYYEYEANKHKFNRSYSIHIELDKTNDYFTSFELDAVEIKFLKHADFYLSDRPGTWKAFDKFIRDEIFTNVGV